jgi:hypothetical protein
MLLNLGANISFSCLPFTQLQQLSSGYNAYLNQNVHMYVDGGVGDLPDVEIDNLNSIGPIFPTGSGALEATIQGYLVKIP